MNYKMEIIPKLEELNSINEIISRLQKRHIK